MAPKKPVKPKKEEAVEIPKTSTIPDGTRTHFIGGWSALTGLQSLETITNDRHSGDKVLLLPGIFNEGSLAIKVRSLTVEGITLADLEVKEDAPKAEGQDDAGNDDAGANAEDDKPKAAVEPSVDASVRVVGALTIEAWIPPVEIKAPTPVVEEVKKDTKPAAKGATKDKKKAVIIDEDVPVVEKAPEPEPQTGANPSAWPTITFRKISFTGSITTKGLHTIFDDCHFVGGAGNQVLVHQYCKATFTRCTFGQPAKTCIYAYPKSVVQAVDCTFTGASAPIRGVTADPAADHKLEAAAEKINSVGVFADDAEAVITACRFRHLAVGVLLHDKCAQAVVSKSDFDRIFNTGCIVDGASAVLRGNTVRRCNYYGLRFKGSKCATKVLQNSIESKVIIEKGANPLLHSNTCAVNLINENEVGNIYMEPTY